MRVVYTTVHRRCIILNFNDTKTCVQEGLLRNRSVCLTFDAVYISKTIQNIKLVVVGNRVLW